MLVWNKINSNLGIILNKKSGLMASSLFQLRSTSAVLSKLNRDTKKIQYRNFYLSRSLYANISFNLTDIGEGIREVVVKEWFVKVGDKVSQFDNICEVQSDKASVTITSRYDGTITKLYYDIDGTAFVGKPLVDIETGNGTDTNVKPVKEITTDEGVSDDTASQSVKPDLEIICIPSVRRLAKENNINLANIKGSGKNGRILKEDILKYLNIETSRKQTVESLKPASVIKEERTEPIRGFRKAMVKTMTEALKIPHFVYCDEIAITKLSIIRKTLKVEAGDLGVKLTFLPFFIKAASNALKDFPVLNATLDKNCENITYKTPHNIGIAMDTTVGLAVPVIKNVQNLSILQIARELNRLMKRGKEGNFSTDDLADGTFCISNIGVIGGTYASPVILSPQVAIIAIGATKVVPRFDSAMNVIPEEIINISGSADHRVVDGVTMAHFINSLKKQIENPYLLLLHT